MEKNVSDDWKYPYSEDRQTVLQSLRDLPVVKSMAEPGIECSFSHSQACAPFMGPHSVCLSVCLEKNGLNSANIPAGNNDLSHI